MEILLVHGIGDIDEQHINNDIRHSYFKDWISAITINIRKCDNKNKILDINFSSFNYKEFFKKHSVGTDLYYSALIELLLPDILKEFHPETEVIEDLLGLIDNITGLKAYLEDRRWDFGMVAQLFCSKGLRSELKSSMNALLSKKNYDLIVAHSLGSLITYDYLKDLTTGKMGAENSNKLKNCCLVSLGSQINNFIVKKHLYDNKLIMPNVSYWYHLYNNMDNLTADISIGELVPMSGNVTNFKSINTESNAGHDPVYVILKGNGYLNHKNTKAEVWPEIIKNIEPK